MQCKHISQKKHKDRGIYIYELIDKDTISLCPDCNMILAEQIMQQLATEVFVGPRLCPCKVCQDEEKREDEDMFNKLKIKEVKDVKKRKKRSGSGSRSRSTKRKKSKD